MLDQKFHGTLPCIRPDPDNPGHYSTFAQLFRNPPKEKVCANVPNPSLDRSCKDCHHCFFSNEDEYRHWLFIHDNDVPDEMQATMYKCTHEKSNGTSCGLRFSSQHYLNVHKEKEKHKVPRLKTADVSSSKKVTNSSIEVPILDPTSFSSRRPRASSSRRPRKPLSSNAENPDPPVIVFEEDEDESLPFRPARKPRAKAGYGDDDYEGEDQGELDFSPPPPNTSTRRPDFRIPRAHRRGQTITDLLLELLRNLLAEEFANEGLATKLNTAKLLLINILCCELYISSDRRREEFLNKIRNFATWSELKEFLKRCVDNFDSEFAYEIAKGR